MNFDPSWWLRTLGGHRIKVVFAIAGVCACVCVCAHAVLVMSRLCSFHMYIIIYYIARVLATIHFCFTSLLIARMAVLVCTVIGGKIMYS